MTPQEHANLPASGTLKRSAHDLKPVLALQTKLSRPRLQRLLASKQIRLGLLLVLRVARLCEVRSSGSKFGGGGEDGDDLRVGGRVVQSAKEGRRGRVENVVLRVTSRAKPPFSL